MPVEGIGGAAEKAAPLVKFPVLMRIVLPGTLAALCIYPFVNGWSRCVPTIAVLSAEWSKLVYVVGAAGFLGILVSSLRGLTFKIYAGRLLWPSWLFNKLCSRRKSLVQRLLDEQEQLPSDNPRYDAIWQTLRLYPMDHNGRPYASHPILLGNIIAAYEKYPLTRYGMPPVFYWSRIWLLLEKEKKEEIDAGWSLADGLLSLSSLAFVAGLSWAATAIAELNGFRPPMAGFRLDSSLPAALSSLGLLGLGYLAYRISLGFHVRNGETFKAVFDLYRDQLSPLLKASPEEILHWRKAWMYLQFLLVDSETSNPPAQPTLVGGSVPPSPKPVAPAQRPNL